MVSRPLTRIAKLAIAVLAVALSAGACTTTATTGQPLSQTAADPTVAPPPPDGQSGSSPDPSVVPTSAPLQPSGGEEDAGEEPEAWEASPFRDAFFDAQEIADLLGGTWERDYVRLLEAEPGTDDGPCGLVLPGQQPGLETQFFEADLSAEFSQTIQWGDQSSAWVDAIGSVFDCEGDLAGVEQVSIEVTGADRAVLASSPPAAIRDLALIAGASVDDVFVGLAVFGDDRASFPTTADIEDMLARALSRASDAAP